MRKAVILIIALLMLSACTSTKPVVDDTSSNSPDVPASNNTANVQTHEPISSQNTSEAKPQSERPVYVEVELKSPPDDMAYEDGLFVLHPTVTEFFNDLDLTTGDFDFAYDENGSYFGYFYDFFEGCSFWEFASLQQDAKATSQLPDDGSTSFSPLNLTKLNRHSSWAEGVNGYGIGESVEIFRTLAYEFDENKLPIVRDVDKQGYFYYVNLNIVNGYASTSELFADYSRVKRLKMYINDKAYAYIDLEDTIKPQYFELYNIPAQLGQTTRFKFEIVDIYPGRSKDITCLTGINFDMAGINAAH